MLFSDNKCKTSNRKRSKIAPNCGFITTNHDFNLLDKSGIGKDIIIGNNCWIGMNSVILPGVKLANHIIVGAGSVVTKSFDEEDIIIAGNPAKKIKNIEKE
jgi:acetyltransferase-like isoleucine patch superfamily enzyme